jgi:hypothetical protein
VPAVEQRLRQDLRRPRSRADRMDDRVVHDVNALCRTSPFNPMQANEALPCHVNARDLSRDTRGTCRVTRAGPVA